ncbi:structural constituent of ribosome [Dioszegia hungarica]|uniref:Structural constituent of ribosome n=1 Tax=Dioszegia hungarica TaxID=4972 RepID=A0AA38HDS5_9TREE|nr:structural constituent of ribosome [Dioszegia hungarica]KAI9638360.1 structural constituent of ribosome [Dioszegia hungarica]
MPTRFSNTRKHRGHVSAGHGRVGKHRKHPGGRGLAGGLRHHRSNMDKFHPGYYGKLGMRHYHLLRNHYIRPTMNVDKLISLPEAKVDAPEGTVPVIDLVHLGHFKLLGKGRINKPFIVKTRFVSALAEKKIKEAGGVVKIVA